MSTASIFHQRTSSVSMLPNGQSGSGNVESLADVHRRMSTMSGVGGMIGPGSPESLSGRCGGGGGGSRGVVSCPTCAKVFNNSSALAKHRLTHTEERKYSCDVCGKAFKRQDHLTGHKLTHSENKPHACFFPNCTKSYCDQRSLKRHLENQHHCHIDNYQQFIATSKEFKQSLMFGDGANTNNNNNSNNNSGRFDSPGSVQSNGDENTRSSLTDASNSPSSGAQQTVAPAVQQQQQQPLSNGTPVVPINIATVQARMVECSICHRKFQSQPALNGHMRLHGGYANLRRESSPGPALSPSENGAAKHRLSTASTNDMSSPLPLDLSKTASSIFSLPHNNSLQEQLLSLSAIVSNQSGHQRQHHPIAATSQTTAESLLQSLPVRVLGLDAAQNGGGLANWPQDENQLRSQAEMYAAKLPHSVQHSLMGPPTQRMSQFFADQQQQIVHQQIQRQLQHQHQEQHNNQVAASYHSQQQQQQQQQVQNNGLKVRPPPLPVQPMSAASDHLSSCPTSASYEVDVVNFTPCATNSPYQPTRFQFPPSSCGNNTTAVSSGAQSMLMCSGQTVTSAVGASGGDTDGESVHSHQSPMPTLPPTPHHQRARHNAALFRLNQGHYQQKPPLAHSNAVNNQYSLQKTPLTPGGHQSRYYAADRINSQPFAHNYRHQPQSATPFVHNQNHHHHNYHHSINMRPHNNSNGNGMIQRGVLHGNNNNNNNMERNNGGGCGEYDLDSLQPTLGADSMPPPSAPPRVNPHRNIFDFSSTEVVPASPAKTENSSKVNDEKTTAVPSHFAKPPPLTLHAKRPQQDFNHLYHTTRPIVGGEDQQVAMSAPPYQSNGAVFSFDFDESTATPSAETRLSAVKEEIRSPPHSSSSSKTFGDISDTSIHRSTSPRDSSTPRSADSNVFKPPSTPPSAGKKRPPALTIPHEMNNMFRFDENTPPAAKRLCIDDSLLDKDATDLITHYRPAPLISQRSTPESDRQNKSPKINEGKEFQAELPSMVPPSPRTRRRCHSPMREQLVFDSKTCCRGDRSNIASDSVNEVTSMRPPDHVTSSRSRKFDLLDEYLSACAANTKHNYGNNLELGLHVLQVNSGDTEAALKALTTRGLRALPSSLQSYSYTNAATWTTLEIDAFEQGMTEHGKNFRLIARTNVKTKTTKECIEFYYLWKNLPNQKQVNGKGTLTTNSCDSGYGDNGHGCSTTTSDDSSTSADGCQTSSSSPTSQSLAIET